MCKKIGKKIVTKSEVIQFLKHHVGQKDIDKTYELISDSINTWRKMKVEGFNYAPCVKDVADSIICFNKNKDKFLAAKLRQINC